MKKLKQQYRSRIKADGHFLRDMYPYVRSGTHKHFSTKQEKSYFFIHEVAYHEYPIKLRATRWAFVFTGFKLELTPSADKASDYRQRKSEPVVTAFFKWVYEQRQNPELLPSNKLLKALNYAGERVDELKVFLGNPHIQIDTNHLERALRVIPMGRKNFLFCWTELSAEQLGMLQSLMVTCRIHDINPYTYLVDVLQRVAIHPAAEVADLTPLQWKRSMRRIF